MTIRRSIDANQLSGKLSNLTSCVDNAPQGSYEQSKAVHRIIGEHCDALIKEMRALGIAVNNSDGIREVEAVIYGWVRSAPNAHQLATAEGFGVACDSSSQLRDRMVEQARGNGEFLARMVRV